MKQFGNHQIIWAICCGLILSLWSYPISAQKLSFKEAFEQAKTDWEVELPHSKGYFYTCDDGFVFSADDRTGVYRYNTQGVKLWEKTDPRRRSDNGTGVVSGGRISQDGRFALTMKAGEDWDQRYPGFYYEYLDAAGNVLWRSHRNYDVGPYLTEISRTGKYLMNEENAMNGRDVLTVWDGKTGEVLWVREGEMSPWKAEFAGEERIAYYYNTTLHLLDSATGNVIWAQNLRPFLPMPFGGVNTRNLSVSEDGSKIAVAMHGTEEKSVVALSDGNGNVSWTKEDFEFPPYETAFSSSAKLLLIHEGSSWILVDVAHGREVWRIKEKVRYDFSLPGRGRMFFEDGAIFVASKFHGTGVLELDESAQMRKYSHFDERIFVFPEKGLPGARKAIAIDKRQNGFRISKRTVNLGGEGR